MNDKNTPPSDITPGMVSFLQRMSGSGRAFENVFKELVSVEDIEGLKVYMANEAVQKGYMETFSYYLLPLKNSVNPEARSIYESAVEWISLLNVSELTARMNRLSQMNLQHHSSSPRLEEIRNLIRLGADIESPICPAKRTPLGEAIVNFQAGTAIAMMAEFSIKHPNRIPLAAKGMDVCTFILRHCIDNADNVKVIDWIGQNIKLSEESKSAPSKYLKKILESDKDIGKEYASAFRLSAFINNDMFSDDVLHLLCSKEKAFPDREYPYLNILSQWPGTSVETIPTLHKLIAAGIDIRAPLSNGAIPLSYNIQAKPSDYIKAFLEAADHSADLEKIMNDPVLMTKVNQETLNMALAITAKNKMMDIIKKNKPVSARAP
jgi:hypothetical protein